MANITEQRYPEQFELPFDFLSFNSELVKEQGSGSYAIGPTFIAKSGKKTPGLTKFWLSIQISLPFEGNLPSRG